MNIAIIGSGISGNVAAYLLSRSHDITLFEKRDRPGGHSATIDVDYDGTSIAVDTGFIVYNELNYPGLTELFAELDVATEESNMSFAFSASTDKRKGVFEWSGKSLNTVFAQRKNIFNPYFLSMVTEILRFNKTADNLDLDAMDIEESLGAWLTRNSFSESFKTAYLLPMGAAIWSTPAEEIMDFPAKSFIGFFVNHRLVSNKRPQWRTVSGGSREYVKRLTAGFADRMVLDMPVKSVTRHASHVTIETADAQTHDFDEVVIATHSDQALAMLADADKEETEILSAVRYKPNQVFLHRDPELMPKRRSTWSAWNYICNWPIQNTGLTAVSYWMNCLQNIDNSKPLFVTLNPPRPPREDLTFGEFEYDHPQFDRHALLAQQKLPMIQGRNRTWFCGAWTGYGFHEDGLQSAFRIAEKMNISPPWQETGQAAIEAAE